MTDKHDVWPIVTARDIEHVLDNAPLFFGVGPETVGVHLESCRVRTVFRGQTFIEPSSSDRFVYVILEGIVAVQLEADADRPLIELVTGQCVGEMSVIENAPPSAYVSAVTDVRLLMLDATTVWKLIGSSHDVARNLLSILSRRLRFNNDHIVDRSEIVEQNRRNAITDALTDLHNRYWMQVMFTRKLKRAKSEQHSLCLAVIDLDHFKRFNDTHGHPLGDTLLQTVASGLRDLFRPADQIARFGGDEFAVLLPKTTLDIALSIAERVRAGLVERLHSTLSQARDVTVSIGVAELCADDTLDSLLDRADQALYRAKDAGRNRSSQ